MKKTIGSLPVWQFILLSVAILAAFTLVVKRIEKRQLPAA